MVGKKSHFLPILDFALNQTILDFPKSQVKNNSQNIWSLSYSIMLQKHVRTGYPVTDGLFVVLLQFPTHAILIDSIIWLGLSITQEFSTYR